MEISWIKLSTDLFNNRKVRQIERMQDGDSIIVIWLKLLVLAGELNDGGEVYLTKGIPFTEESLSIQLDRPRELVALALRTFEAYGMIEIREKCIYITNWEKYQNIEGMERVREQNRLRKQKQREREKQDPNQSHVTSRDGHGTDKRREDKNRYSLSDEAALRDKFRQQAAALSKQWQSNVDADEANKEIRT